MELKKVVNSKFGAENIFEFNYRARYRVTTDHIAAKDLNEAKEKALKYCDRFDLRYISVRPFLLNMEKQPRDKSGTQVDTDENKEVVEAKVS